VHGVSVVVLPGATGDLGQRLARALVGRATSEGTTRRALVRDETLPERVVDLEQLGVTPVRADYDDPVALAGACEGASVVVSTLSGLHPVVVGAQSALLEAAVDAGVPRFVPSDYSADYTTIPPGTNRNLELRREFRRVLDSAPITSTSVLVGAFTDLLVRRARHQASNGSASCFSGRGWGDDGRSPR
jgi:uncharacterized protein YbjT (DUF2867 family)